MSRDTIRARVAAARPRCQYLLGGEVRCGLWEPMHVPNVTDHPFLYVRSLDDSPDADLRALLAVADAAAKVAAVSYPLTQASVGPRPEDNGAWSNNLRLSDMEELRAALAALEAGS